MQLKTIQHRPWVVKKTQEAWQQKSKTVYRLLQFILVLLISCSVFITGAISQQIGVIDNVIVPTLLSNVKIVPNSIKGALVKPNSLVIDIKHEDFLKLAYQRDQALKIGGLVLDEDSYVPATVSYNGQPVNVSIRLKGDQIDHFDTDKWSFRIKVKQDNTIAGMKQFSLHHPKTRRYIHEWIFHQALKKDDILSLRYQFINVTLNGKDLGIYAVEEHFEKRLIEHNNRREGPIIRFNENLFWAEVIATKHIELIKEKEQIGLKEYSASDIDAFHTNQLLSNPVSNAQYIEAINLLESFREGTLTTSQVFDTEKLATYFAIADVLSAIHAARWTNIRFYYNPISSRLEPIGFDASFAGLYTNSLAGIHLKQAKDAKFINSIFSDIAFTELYIQKLEYVSNSAYLDELFSEIDPELQNNLAILYKEFPYLSFSTDAYYGNQQYIKSILAPPKGLHAYYHQANKSAIELELGNIQAVPIEVLSVSYQDSNQDTKIFQAVQRVILTPREFEALVQYQVVKFELPPNFNWSKEMISNLKVNYKLLGTSSIRSETVFAWSYLEEGFAENDFIRQPANATEFEFLTINETNKYIVINPGVWNVSQNLIIPPGYTVIARDKTTLNLSNQAKILSYSALDFSGNEENPIIIKSTDGTGQGVVVMNANMPSFLNYVIFNNLSNPAEGNWGLTGAVTFYESPIFLYNVQFINNQAEDTLNIVRSGFTMDQVLFSNAASDAFDSDFSQGKIANSRFVNSGNDAIDLSGSAIELESIIIDGAGDKGLSAGENSYLWGETVEINQAEIAIASKDNSQITLKAIKVTNGGVGLAAYQKKSEFGPAQIELEEMTMIDVEVPYLLETGSTIQANKNFYSANQENITDILYGVEFGKSSK